MKSRSSHFFLEKVSNNHSNNASLLRKLRQEKHPKAPLDTFVNFANGSLEDFQFFINKVRKKPVRSLNVIISDLNMDDNEFMIYIKNLVRLVNFKSLQSLTMTFEINLHSVKRLNPLRRALSTRHTYPIHLKVQGTAEDNAFMFNTITSFVRDCKPTTVGIPPSGLSEQQWEKLCNTLKKNIRLSNIAFIGCGLRTEKLPPLLKLLQSAKLKYLNLSCNDLEPMDVKVLMACLQAKNPNVEVRLNANEISEAAIDVINFRKAQKNPELDLRECCITDKNVADIAIHCTSFQKIDLSWNNITDKGLEEFLTMLQSKPNDIEHLNFSLNDFTKDSIDNLSRFLSDNPKWKSVTLSSYRIGQEDFSAWEKLIEVIENHNTNLVEFNSGVIGGNTALSTRLKAVLERNSRLLGLKDDLQNLAKTAENKQSWIEHIKKIQKDLSHIRELPQHNVIYMPLGECIQQHRDYLLNKKDLELTNIFDEINSLFRESLKLSNEEPLSQAGGGMKPF